jgi:hypothetical protein
MALILCLFMLFADYRVYAACKVATMLLKSSGRRRISGVEAFERIMVLVPVSCLLFS